MGTKLRLRESPSQTAGPYVHIGCVPNTCGVGRPFMTDLGAVMLGDKTPGERIAVEGQIFDGAGDVLKDALIEVWQADHAGQYATATAGQPGVFSGWGRQATDLDTGRFRFETIKPGCVQCADGRLQAPHISFWIVARGINLGLNTRMYFSDEAQANAKCPVFLQVEEQFRPTLTAERNGDVYIFDIYLQGAKETVFFDI